MTRPIFRHDCRWCPRAGPVGSPTIERWSSAHAGRRKDSRRPARRVAEPQLASATTCPTASHLIARHLPMRGLTTNASRPVSNLPAGAASLICDWLERDLDAWHGHFIVGSCDGPSIIALDGRKSFGTAMMGWVRLTYNMERDRIRFIRRIYTAPLHANCNMYSRHMPATPHILYAPSYMVCMCPYSCYCHY